jgi:hypothetical protein
MKPILFFGAVLTLLAAGGTFAGRYAGDGSGGHDTAVAAGLIAMKDAPEMSAPFPATNAERLGQFTLADGEAAALRHIGQSMEARPASPITVEWTEVYKARSVVKRARYLPRARRLEYERQGSFSWYAPVTPAGIRTALGHGPGAPFANAHLFSLPKIAFH